VDENTTYMKRRKGAGGYAKKLASDLPPSNKLSITSTPMPGPGPEIPWLLERRLSVLFSVPLGWDSAL